MKDYPEFRAATPDILALLAGQPMVRLLTIDPDGWPRAGLYVFVHDGLSVELHLVRNDPQLEDLKRDSRAAVEVDSILAFAPSFWVDEGDASHADQFYCSATLRGRAQLIDDADAVRAHLSKLLARYQPEGRHAPVSAPHPLYDGYVKRLMLVRLSADAVSSKFKLGQRSATESLANIVRELRLRGTPLDQRTADAIEAARARIDAAVTESR